MSEPREKEIILLVGGNPLPNYVAAHVLRAKCGIERVSFVYTPEVKEVKDNLYRCLAQAGFSCKEAIYIDDAADAQDIRDKCNDIDPGAHLHYTGGTNVMATHVYAIWKKKGGEERRASYLSGKDDRLRVDDGTEIDIENVPLDLATLATLHGLQDCQPRQNCHGGPCLPNDADEIATKVFEKPKLAGKLYKKIPGKISDFKKTPFDPQTKDLCLSEKLIPVTKVWQRFLRGEWLEEWVYQQVQETGLVDDENLHVGIKPKINVPGCNTSREFELDVVAIRKHHLYVMSCTTASQTSLCKSKLFEVAMRARQLGGDLARSALVCLAKSVCVDQLQKDMHSLSESSRIPKVYGLEHVREWIGFNERKPDLKSLKDWLEDRQ